MVIATMYDKEPQHTDVIRYQVAQQQWHVVYLGNLVHTIVTFTGWVHGRWGPGLEGGEQLLKSQFTAFATEQPAVFHTPVAQVHSFRRVYQGRHRPGRIHAGRPHGE